MFTTTNIAGDGHVLDAIMPKRDVRNLSGKYCPMTSAGDHSIYDLFFVHRPSITHRGSKGREVVGNRIGAGPSSSCSIDQSQTMSRQIDDWHRRRFDTEDVPYCRGNEPIRVEISFLGQISVAGSCMADDSPHSAAISSSCGLR